LEVGLFLVISAELRAIQLARARTPCIEMLFERLPTVSATAGTTIIITGIRSRQNCYIGVTESAGPSDGCGFAAAIDGRS